MEDLEHKTLELKELTDEGRLQAVISTFGRDRDGDVMTAAAFKGSDGKSIPMVWSHDWTMPVGKGSIAVGTKGVTFTGQFFMDTTDGENAYRRVRAMGDLQEYSIGFRVKEADFGYQEDDAGERVYTRTIKDLELFEASPVLVGAAYGTRTLAIKSPKGQEDLHAQLKALYEQHDEMCELGDDCPLLAAVELNLKAPAVVDERAKALQELEAVLGYRPLIAGKGA